MVSDVMCEVLLSPPPVMVNTLSLILTAVTPEVTLVRLPPLKYKVVPLIMKSALPVVVNVPVV